VTVPLAINDFWADEISLKTCYGGSPEDASIAFSLISGRRLNLQDMVTHRLGLGEIARGFQLVSEARESIKVIIEPHK
jgi:L-iditol 2-dehydrogenase